MDDRLTQGTTNQNQSRREKNCFGMSEWQAVREAASRFLPHTAAAAWKHRNLSQVEQEGLSPMPKDRGAKQGDVDGSLECGLALGIVAAETRGRIAARQVAGTLLWIGFAIVSRPRKPSARNSQLPEKRTRALDPQHALQKNGGLADLWCMDNGDIMCHPIANASRSGAEPTKNGSRQSEYGS